MILSQCVILTTGWRHLGFAGKYLLKSFLAKC